MEPLASLFWNPAERRVRAFWRVLLVVGITGVAVVALSVSLLPGLAFPWQAFGSIALDVAVPLAVVLLGARLLDRRRFASYGFGVDRRWWADLGAGALLGLVLYGIAFVMLLAAGWAEVSEVLSPGAQGGFWPVLLLAAVAYMTGAFWEELVFRGVIIKNAAEGLAGRRSQAAAVAGAVVISTVVFAVLHVPVYAAGPLPVSRLFALWLLLGLMLGLAYAVTGQLAFPIGLHFGVNFAINNLFGLLGEAGAQTATLFRIEIVGPDALATVGGAVHIAVVLLGFALLVAWARWRRGGLAFDTGLTQPPEAVARELGRPEPPAGAERAGAGRTGGRGALGLLAVGLVVVLSGCQLVVGTAQTVRSINAETGARDVSIHFEGTRGHDVEVEYGTGQTGQEALRAEAETVAGVVWRELPLRIERARIAPHGGPAVTYERAELEDRFGARDPELDREIGSILWPVLLGAVALLLIAGLLAAVIAIALTRRHERRRQASRPPGS